MKLKDILKLGKIIEALEMTRACQDFLHVVKVMLWSLFMPSLNTIIIWLIDWPWYAVGDQRTQIEVHLSVALTVADSEQPSGPCTSPCIKKLLASLEKPLIQLSTVNQKRFGYGLRY